MDQLHIILEDCHRCIAYMERLYGDDEATGQLWEAGTGYFLHEMNMFVLVTQAAKVFCPGSSQALALQKLAGAVRHPDNHGTLEHMLTVPREHEPKAQWHDVTEVYDWVERCRLALRPHAATMDHIRAVRNSVTAHTQAHHEQGKPNHPPSELPELTALVQTGSTMLSELYTGMTGWSRAPWIDDKSFDRLIAGYSPVPR